MPPSFTDEERRAIRQRLIAAARRIGPALGLKGLTIDALAREARISKGAFYAFYDGKEALYLDVIAAEAPGVRARVLRPLDDAAAAPRAAFEAFLSALFREYAENPVLRRLIANPDELAAIQRKAGRARMAAKAELGFKPLLAFLARAEAAGALRVGAPETVLGLVAALPRLLLHKDALERESDGAFQWPAIEAVLIRALSTGLFEPSAPETARETGSGGG